MPTVVALRGGAPGTRAPSGSRIAIGFWVVVVLSVLTLAWLYCLPAANKIDRQQAALEQAQTRLKTVEGHYDALEAELDGLDDPFYVESVLRAEYGWTTRR